MINVEESNVNEVSARAKTAADYISNFKIPQGTARCHQVTKITHYPIARPNRRIGSGIQSAFQYHQGKYKLKK